MLPIVESDILKDSGFGIRIVTILEYCSLKCWLLLCQRSWQ